MTDRVQIGDWCTLYHADSTEIVEELRAVMPDAVIMDPPYGVGFRGVATLGTKGADYRAVRPLKFSGQTVHGDEQSPDISPWLRFPNVLTWGADHLRSQLPDGGRFLVWDKTERVEFNDTFSDAELAWHSRRGAVRSVAHMWKGICTSKAGGDTGYRDHPMQKPIRVMEWCVDQCRLEPGALILDPYMGSGTTAIAAFKKRMKFVGVEIDRRWFDVAVERIKRQTEDGPLFSQESADMHHITPAFV